MSVRLNCLWRLALIPVVANIFPLACEYQNNTKIIKYFIDKCQCDINIEHSSALYCAFENFHWYDIAKLLLDMGINVSDDSISNGIYDDKNIDLLLEHGVPLERLASVFLNRSQELKKLFRRGVDFSKIVCGKYSVV